MLSALIASILGSLLGLGPPASEVPDPASPADAPSAAKGDAPSAAKGDAPEDGGDAPDDGGDAPEDGGDGATASDAPDDHGDAATASDAPSDGGESASTDGQLPAHDQVPPDEPEPEPEIAPEPEPEPPPPSTASPAPGDGPVPAPAARSRTPWRVWASPLGSTFIPGLGQFFNNQGGKGTGLLFASVGSVAISAALYTLPNDGTRGVGAEYARLVSFGAFSTAAPLLWIYAIADAYRVAAGEDIEPNVDHKVRISVARMMTVGFRADPSRPGFYDDWSVSVMGQAARRFSVGISDLSIKSGGQTGPQIWQFGARLGYRVVEQRRVWLELSLGSVLQVASGREPGALDPDAAFPPRSLRFGAVPYGQLDLRIFVLDRLSLDVVPRFSVPVTTRYYAAQRALPRYAPTLELGAGVSVLF